MKYVQIIHLISDLKSKRYFLLHCDPLKENELRPAKQKRNKIKQFKKSIINFTVRMLYKLS